MNRFLSCLAVVLVCAAVLLPLAGCSGASGCNAAAAPTITLRNPFLIDREVPTVAGERLRYVPQPPVLAAPSWSAIQAPAYTAPSSCAPPPAYTNPCSPGGDPPQSVPALRR